MKAKILLPKIIFLFILFLLITACKQNRFDAKTDDIKLDVKIERFEKEFYGTDTSHLKDNLNRLYKKYPDIIQIYTEQLYRDYFRKYLRQDSLRAFKELFFSNKNMLGVFDDVQKTITNKDIEKLEAELTDALKRYKYFFPKEKLPRFATCMASFGIKCFNTYDKNPCICLDMYLGRDYKYYNARNIDFPLYQSRKMEKPYMLPDLISTFFESKYDRDSLTDRTILSKMIYAGKQLYFLNLLCPEMPDSLILGYTKAQAEWCASYEKEVWKHFNAKEIFFSTDENKRIVYLGDGPFTNADEMPQESAPRLGEWLGWQLVRRYMVENNNVTLAQLFAEKDAQKILKGSKYKP